MNPTDFINQNVNQQIDLDGFPAEQPYQCYDLVNKWSESLGHSRFTGLYASDIFGQQPESYQWINNTPTRVPQAGDVIVWNRSYGNGAGHTAVATGAGDRNNFQSLDQNWNAPRCLLQWHSYDGVIGWGRPNNIRGGNMPDYQGELENERKGYQALLETYNNTVAEMEAERKGYDAAVAEIAKLKEQLKNCAGGTLDQATKDQIKETNTNTNLLVTWFKKIFNIGDK